MAAIPSQRHLFDLPDDVAYLNCAYMSPWLRASTEAAARGSAHEARPWTVRPDDFFAPLEGVRGLFASLIGASADDVAIVPAASYGLAAAALNLRVRRGQSILMLDNQYPSNVHCWRRLATRCKAQVKSVARPADGDWTAAVLAALDDDVAVVSLPNCHWMDGGLVDVAAVGERARAVGAALVIDASQSLGALPLDVSVVQPDFLVTSGYKWMLCPYGISFLYVAPRWQDGVPLEENALNRAGAEVFSRLAELAEDYRPGARRYDVGERAHFTLLPAAAAALRQLLDWGAANTQETLRDKTRRIAERAQADGMIPTPAERRAGHFLGLRLQDGVPPGLSERLAAVGVHVSVRGETVRITPHLYTTEADIDRLFAALAAAYRPT